MFETDRLILRPFIEEDLDWLIDILGDPATMAHYPQPFSERMCKDWIARSQTLYKEGAGLYAIQLKASNAMIGDCGITYQMIDGERLPEIGYHIHRDHQGHGFATEAASFFRLNACSALQLPAVYSYMTADNAASRRTAEKIGMTHHSSFYRDDVEHAVYRVHCIARTSMEKRS
ncbi:GNAT family N-acetyltransferase [Alkalicoccus luteus]|uniref:GNAT family N-acetyltransferase n=1 Tax=Alkalicoccus luteus TaxID=1237094 RepID=A0A969PVW0_9BACI|nr:GNAT family N-acetyltransferase [Alkalicoccus luteus]NJP38464.1 GNAT family N-acetyltransferase [Alkalicoccus luteus]